MTTEKYLDYSLIDTNGTISYLLETYSYGEVDTNTIVYDKIPEGTTFVEAQLDGLFNA